MQHDLILVDRPVEVGYKLVVRARYKLDMWLSMRMWKSQRMQYDLILVDRPVKVGYKLVVRAHYQESRK